MKRSGEVSERSQKTKEKIEQIIKTVFHPLHIDIEDETWRHAGHAGAAQGGGHFNLVLVSDQFEGVNLLERNRKVFSALQEEMEENIHALSIKVFSASEWDKNQGRVA